MTPAAADGGNGAPRVITRSTFLSLAAAAPIAAWSTRSGRSAGPTPAAEYPVPTVLPLTRSGTGLGVGGSTTRLSGLNAYWLGLDDNAGASPGTFPSRQQITAAMAGMREMGATLVRAHTIGISAGTPMSYLTGYSGTSPRYVESNMAAADWAVSEAGRNGIYLMCPLTDEWNYYHGGDWWFVEQAYLQNPSGLTYVDGSVKDDTRNRQFFGNTAAQLRIRALFKGYVASWLKHVNQYTGVAYRDDPTIAIIETGNEIYPATAEWTADLAGYIKGIAGDKLVADGSAASGLAVSAMPGLDIADVDIVGSHYYPNTGSPAYGPAPMMSAAGTLASDVAAAGAAGKAFVVGEYPWSRADIADWYSLVEGSSAVAADLAWSFIADSDSGVPETHGGAWGSDDYPIHRPYAGSREQRYAPAAARHIARLSGVAPTDGAGTDPTASDPVNLLRSADAAAADAAWPFASGGATLRTDTAGYRSGGSSVRAAVQAPGYPFVYVAAATTAGAPVAGGQTVTASMWVRPETAHRFAAHLSWFTGTGAYVSGVDGAAVSCAAGTWTHLTATSVAPATAVYAVPQIDAQDLMTAGSFFNLDDLGIAAGPVPAT